MFQSVSRGWKFRVRNSRSFSSGRELRVIPSRISRRDPPREATLNRNVISGLSVTFGEWVASGATPEDVAHCIFERKYGEMLGLHVESGRLQRFRTGIEVFATSSCPEFARVFGPERSFHTNVSGEPNHFPATSRHHLVDGIAAAEVRNWPTLRAFPDSPFRPASCLTRQPLPPPTFSGGTFSPSPVRSPRLVYTKEKLITVHAPGFAAVHPVSLPISLDKPRVIV
jgi:hypothetical protein